MGEDHLSSIKLEFYKEMLVDLSLWELTFNYFAFCFSFP